MKEIAVQQAQALSAASLAAMKAAGSGNNSYYGKDPWMKMLEDFIEGYFGTDAQSAMRNVGQNVKNSGIVNAVATAAKNVATTVAKIFGGSNSSNAGKGQKVDVGRAVWNWITGKK